MKIDIEIKIDIQKSLNFEAFLKNLNLCMDNVEKIIKSIENARFGMVFIPLPTL